jgi:hypothetical protein
VTVFLHPHWRNLLHGGGSGVRSIRYKIHSIKHNLVEWNFFILRRAVFEQCGGENVGTVKEKEKMV